MLFKTDAGMGAGVACVVYVCVGGGVDCVGGYVTGACVGGGTYDVVDCVGW